MKKWLLVMMMAISALSFAQEKMENSEERGGETSVVAPSGISKGDSFMAAFGMGDTSNTGGETGGETSGSTGSATVGTSTGGTTAGTTVGTILSNQGMNPNFTPYGY